MPALKENRLDVHLCGNSREPRWTKSIRREKGRKAFDDWRFSTGRRSTSLIGFSLASMRPLKNISFFEGEKSISVNVACEQLTGTGLDTLFCTGWPESTRVH